MDAAVVAPACAHGGAPWFHLGFHPDGKQSGRYPTGTPGRRGTGSFRSLAGPAIKAAAGTAPSFTPAGGRHLLSKAIFLCDLHSGEATGKNHIPRQTTHCALEAIICW